MPRRPRITRALTSLLGNPEVTDRTARLSFRDAGHGYDRFGLHPDYVAFGDALAGTIYDRYFRVQSTGSENIPSEGPAILAANHSGTIPLDGAMLWVDVVRNTQPPRVPRAVADYFVPSLPVLGTLFARCGVVGGSRGNVRALLEGGELLMIFPEGVPGIGKPFRDRYQLQEWRQGHCELAIRHRAPVVPIAIIGAEEQMPQLARLPFFEPVPYIPITATPVPLPVRYHIHYGTPIPLHRDYRPEQADDADVVAEAALRVKAAVAGLIEQGLATRESVFR